MRIFRRIRTEVVRASHQPKRTSLAVALGVWLAFSPFVGLHLISGFLLARVFRLNTPIILFAAMIHNPWTMIGIHLSGLTVGALLLHGNLESLAMFKAFPWSQLNFGTVCDTGFWSMNWSHLKGILLPFMSGSLLLSFAFGALAYGLSLKFIRNRQKTVPADA